MSERPQYLIRLNALTLTPISAELRAIAEGDRVRHDGMSEPDQIGDEGRALADRAATLEAVADMIDTSAAALRELTA